VLSALVPGLSRAQSEKEVDHNAQVWVSLNTTTRLSDSWGVVADVHVRRDDFLEEPSFYFGRFAAHRWLTEKLTATAGYAHMWLPPAQEGWQAWSNENRLYEQLQYASKAGRVSVLQRVRSEQRWKQVVEDDVATGESTFSNRVRYLLSLTLPVAGGARPLALVLSDEILLQFGSSVVLNTFDQNRLFAGVKLGLSRAWSFDLGYMQVFQQKASGYQYDLNHTLRWFFYWTPDRRPSARGPVHEPASGGE
jgi:hypothetical protein